jgi:hypothetical protein
MNTNLDSSRLFVLPNSPNGIAYRSSVVSEANASEQTALTFIAYGRNVRGIYEGMVGNARSFATKVAESVTISGKEARA